jgi:hypothetical protein
MLEMDDSVVKQMMDTQTQMLNSIQGMQTQTLTIIQQNTAALQGVQLNQGMTPLVVGDGGGSSMASFSSPPESSVLAAPPPQLTPIDSMVSIGTPPTPPITATPNMVGVNQYAMSAPPIQGVNMGPTMPNMAQAPLYTNPGLVSTNLYTAMPGSLNAQTQSNPTTMFREFQNQDMGLVSDVANMFVDPRQYQAYSTHGNPFSYMAKQHMNFSGHKASAFGRQEFVEDTTNNITGNIMNAAGATAEGVANLGGFFIPGNFLVSTGLGLAAGAATSVAVGEMLRGGQVSQQYEDIIRRQSYQFINPSEGMTEYGTVGFNRQQRQELGDFMRNLAPEKFLDDTEMQQMLTGAMDNKMLKSVGNAETFKRRVSETIDAAKKIMITMDQSIEEAMNFMGEMESRGIHRTRMNNVAANIKVASSYGYMTASQGAEMVLGTTDAITRGTAVGNADVATTVSQNIALANILHEKVFTGAEDPRMYNYVKNLSGGANEFGQNYEMGIRNHFSQKGMEQYFFAPAFELGEDGRFQLNQTTFEGILNSQQGSETLKNNATIHLSEMDAVTKGMFMAQAPDLMNEALNNPVTMGQSAFFIQKLFNEQTRQNLDLGQSLFYSGAFSNINEADAVAKMATVAADGNVVDTLAAQAWQQEINTVPPGLLDRASASYRSVMNKTLGNLGSYSRQYVSDQLQEVNMWLENMPDRTSSNSLSMNPVDISNTSKEYVSSFSGGQAFNDFNENINTGLVEAGLDPISAFAPRYSSSGQELYKVEELSFEQFESYKKMIEENGITRQMAGILQPMRSGDYGPQTQMRSNYLLSLPGGTAKDEDLEKIEENKGNFYDPDTRQPVKLEDANDLTFTVGGKDIKISEETEIYSDDEASFFNVFEAAKEEFRKKEGEAYTDILNYTNELMTSNDMTAEDAAKLERAIATGDNEGRQKILNEYGVHTGRSSQLAENYKTIVDEGTKKLEAFDSQMERTDYYNAFAKTGVNLEKMMTDTMGMDKKDYNLLFGKTVAENAQYIINKDGNDWLEIDDDDMDFTDMQTWGENIRGQMETGFRSMTQEQMTALVENEYGLASRARVNPDAFKTNGQYDPALIMNAVLNLGNKMSASPTDKEDSGDGSGSVDELSKVIFEHETAFRDMVSAFQREITIARNASNPTISIQ